VAIHNNKVQNTADVSVGRPSTFVEVSTPQFDRSTRTLTAKVTAGKEFFGPRCPVDLDLRPERIPFLAPKQKREGSYGGVLNRPGDELLLEAHTLQIEPSKDPGLVYLTVDDYQRAFTYEITNFPGATAQLTAVTDPVLRLLAPPVAASGGPSKVSVEADNIPDGARIELGLYRGKFTKDQLDGDLMLFAGARRTAIFFSPQGPDGGLLFRTEAADWTTGLSTAKVYGKRTLRMRLVNGKGEELEFRGALGNERLAPVKQITAGLMVDGSPPEDVKFV